MNSCCEPVEHVFAEVGTVVPPDDSRDPPEVLDDVMTAVDVGTVVCHLFDEVSHAPGRDNVGAIELTALPENSRPVTCAGPEFHADQVRRKFRGQHHARVPTFSFDPRRLAVIIHATRGRQFSRERFPQRSCFRTSQLAV